MIRPLFFYKKTLKKFLEKCDVSRFNDWFAPPIWYNNVTRLREKTTKNKLKNNNLGCDLPQEMEKQK